MCQRSTNICNKWTQHNARIAACNCNASFEFRSWRSVSARTSMRPRRLGGFALGGCEYDFFLWFVWLLWRMEMWCSLRIQLFPLIWESAWPSCTILHQVDLAKKIHKAVLPLSRAECAASLCAPSKQPLQKSARAECNVTCRPVMSLEDPKISQLNSSKNICSSHAFKQ